jgi:hypothetical protein
MAMKIKFNIHAFGYGAKPQEFGEILIHNDGYGSHEYEVRLVRGPHMIRTYRGTVPNDNKSGHRNILHLLARIMDDLPLDTMGEDYVHVNHLFGGRPSADYKATEAVPEPEGWAEQRAEAEKRRAKYRLDDEPWEEEG